MKYSVLFLALFAIVFGFSSCQEDDELLPTQLEGVWEERSFVDSLDYWVVNTIDFDRNGTYQARTTVRDSENGPDLGHRFYFDTKYDWDTKILTYFPNEGYFLNTSKFYTPKAKLVLAIMCYFRQPKAQLTFSADGKTMNYLEIFEYDLNFEPHVANYIRVR